MSKKDRLNDQEKPNCECPFCDEPACPIPEDSESICGVILLTCPACKNKVQKGAATCPNCGETFHGED